jgi:hypothetical protein
VKVREERGVEEKGDFQLILQELEQGPPDDGGIQEEVNEIKGLSFDCGKSFKWHLR